MALGTPPSLLQRFTTNLVAAVANAAETRRWLLLQALSPGEWGQNPSFCNGFHDLSARPTRFAPWAEALIAR